MNPTEHVWDLMGRNVCKRNDIVTLDDLVRALVDELNNRARVSQKTSVRYAMARTRVTPA